MKVTAIDFHCDNKSQMAEVLLFYDKVLGVKFEQENFGNSFMFYGQLGDVTLRFIPMNLNNKGVTSFEIEIPKSVDFKSITKLAETFGRRISSTGFDNGRVYCMFADPLDNTVCLTQSLY